MQSALLSLTVRDIQYPNLRRCQLALPAPPSLLPPALLCSLHLSSFSPECLARRHAVSQHPALNEKGLLKFIRGRRLRGPVGLPATFLPFQHRTGETEQREQPFIWGFLWTPSPFSRPWYPWISHSAKKDHQSDRAWCIWRGNGVHNNSIPEGHPSLPTPGNRVPRSNIMGYSIPLSFTRKEVNLFKWQLSATVCVSVSHNSRRLQTANTTLTYYHCIELMYHMLANSCLHLSSRHSVLPSTGYMFLCISTILFPFI